MKKIFMLMLLLSGAGFLIIACSNPSSTKVYRGNFGDKYVFVEFQALLFTQGDSGSVNLKQYKYNRDGRTLTLNVPLTDRYADFDLIYGTDVQFDGSFTGEMNFADKATNFPHSTSLSQMTQQDFPFNINATFNSISSLGDVSVTLSLTDTSLTSTVDTTLVLPADSSFQTPATPTFPLVFNQDTLHAIARIKAINYGFQQKQKIRYNTP